MQPLTQSGAASEKGYALKLAEVCSETGRGRKMAAHNAKCRGAGVSFVPLAVELLGGWSHEAALQISRIGRLVGQRLGTTPAEAVSHLFQRLSICLWRGNAPMWARRLPSHSAWTDGNIFLFSFFCLLFCLVLSCFVFVTVPPIIWTYIIIQEGIVISIRRMANDCSYR